MIYGNSNYVDYKKIVYENVYIFELKENMLTFYHVIYLKLIPKQLLIINKNNLFVHLYILYRVLVPNKQKRKCEAFVRHTERGPGSISIVYFLSFIL